MKIVRTWDEMPPTVYDGDEAYSTRVLEMNYRNMESALKKIAEIENRFDCGDWDEIEEAREIARNAKPY